MRFYPGVLLICGLAACQAGPASESNLQVTNSQSAEGLFPGIVKLDLMKGLDQGLCTGSMVTETWVLTAAHCVLDVHSVVINGRSSREIYSHPLWVPNDQGSSGYDLALVKFDAPVSQAILKIADRVPEPGARARMVGYGFTDWNTPHDAGQKRQGDTIIEAIEPFGSAYMIYSSGCNGAYCSSSDTASALGQGDSGGPLLVGDKIVGVASLGALSGSQALSWHAPVHQQTNLDFIKEHIPDLNLAAGSLEDPAGAPNQRVVSSVDRRFEQGRFQQGQRPYSNQQRRGGIPNSNENFLGQQAGGGGCG